MPSPRAVALPDHAARSGRRALFAAVGLLALACGDDSSPRERFADAVQASDLAAAREVVRDVGEEIPDTPAAVIELSRLLVEVGEMNRAQWILKQAVERHPDQHALRHGLAETSLRVGDAVGAQEALAGLDDVAYVEVLRSRADVMLGRLEDGLRRLERAQERFDEPVMFRVERIELLEAEGRYEEALAIVREMQADPAQPDDVRAWLPVKRSELVARTEGPEAALASLDELWDPADANAEIATRRTAALLTLGRAGEAVAAMREALAARPERAALYSVAAQAAIADGDPELAEEWLREHVRLDPDGGSLGNLALFLDHRGRTTEAAELLASRPEVTNSAQRLELRYLAIALWIEAGELERARAAAAEFGRDHPNNPRYDYLLGRLEIAEGKPQQAAERLARVLARFDRPDVKHMLGVALEHAGDLAGAEVRYGLAVIEDPGQLPSWLGLLRTLPPQGKWEAAADVAQRVIQLAPAQGFAYRVLADASVALERPDEAERSLVDHVGRNPGLPGPRVALSLVLRQQGRPAEALETLDALAPDVRTGNVEVAAERAVVLAQLGRPDEAATQLAAVEGPDSRALRRARIYVAIASGRADAAFELVEAASAADPRDPAPDRMAADYLASLGRFEDALPYYRRALERAPDAGTAFRLAIALEAAGRSDEAIAAYRRAIAIDARAIGPRNNLALALARDGELREALVHAQRAWALAGSDPVVMDTLGTLYLEWGLAARAAALLEQARDVAPAMPEVRYHLALAYRESERAPQARALLGDLAASLPAGHELRASVDDALATLR